jgi:hypothetical protein
MSLQPAVHSANDIAARFCEERDAIVRHLERVTRRLTISAEEVSVLHRAAAQVGFHFDDHSLRDIERLHDVTDQLKPAINARLQDEEPRLERLRSTGPAAEPHYFECELVQYFRDALREGDSIDQARASALVQAEENRREMGEDWPYSESDLLSALDRAVRLAEFSVCAEDINVIDDVDELWKASQSDAFAHAQQQAFGMLMRAFETAIFELMRLASRRLNGCDYPHGYAISRAISTGRLIDVLPALRNAEILRGISRPSQGDDWSEATRVCADVVEQIRAWVNVIESRKP